MNVIYNMVSVSIQYYLINVLYYGSIIIIDHICNMAIV